MKVIGLTGSIGMGKTTVGKMFRRCYRIPVFEADDHTHTLLRTDAAIVDMIKTRFPQAIDEKRVNRRYLAQTVVRDVQALDWLESVIHPRIDQRLQTFLRRSLGHEMVVIVIPLLFEKGYTVDQSLVVTAPKFIQESRVIGRNEMTREKFNLLAQRQWSDRRKKRQGDFILPTGAGYRVAFTRLTRIVRLLKKNAAKKPHPPRWLRYRTPSGLKRGESSTAARSEPEKHVYPRSRRGDS